MSNMADGDEKRGRKMAPVGVAGGGGGGDIRHAKIIES